MSEIPIKTEDEIRAMREGGKLVASFFEELKEMANPGLDSWQLEERFIELCDRNDVIPACKNYAPKGFPPFPTGLCLSFNEQSVHCFPIKGRKESVAWNAWSTLVLE